MSRPRWKGYMLVRVEAPPWRFADTKKRQPEDSPRSAPTRSTRSVSRTGTRFPPHHDRNPSRPAGLDLRGRAVRDGVHGFLYFSDTALRAVARDERWRDRHAGRRTLAAGGLSVDPCRRADGPLRHAAGDIVIRLDRYGHGAGLSAGAVVLAIAVVAAHQWRRAVLCLVGLADPDCPTDRRRGRVYRPLQLLRPYR